MRPDQLDKQLGEHPAAPYGNCPCAHVCHHGGPERSAGGRHSRSVLHPAVHISEPHTRRPRPPLPPCLSHQSAPHLAATAPPTPLPFTSVCPPHAPCLHAPYNTHSIIHGVCMLRQEAALPCCCLVCCTPLPAHQHDSFVWLVVCSTCTHARTHAAAGMRGQKATVILLLDKMADPVSALMIPNKDGFGTYHLGLKVGAHDDDLWGLGF